MSSTWEREALPRYCAEALISEYYSLSHVRVSVEPWEPGLCAPRRGGESVEVYVKSVREPSIDEIPLISAILEALGDRRLALYEYENMTRSPEGVPRQMRLARLLEHSVQRGTPLIVVVPSALPASLYSHLSPTTRRALSEAAILRVRVEHPNYLYLPTRAAHGEIELVAKENSKSSYERVVWLKEQAGRKGFRRVKVTYLPDNRSIMNYVLWGGPQGVARKVPVNKLALYLIVLGRCGVLEGLETLVRVEESTHLVYTLNLDCETLEHIVDGLRFEGKLRGVLRGVLYSQVLGGAMGVFEEILGILL